MFLTVSKSLNGHNFNFLNNDLKDLKFLHNVYVGNIQIWRKF